MEQVYNRAADPVTTLGTSAVVDVWKGADYGLLKNVTSNGLRAVLSGCWYLDIVSGATAWGREWLDYCELPLHLIRSRYCMASALRLHSTRCTGIDLFAHQITATHGTLKALPRRKSW
jgi:hypothetical protein